MHTRAREYNESKSLEQPLEEGIGQNTEQLMEQANGHKEKENEHDEDLNMLREEVRRGGECR